MEVILDLKQLARETTFTLYIKVKHLRWWAFRLWVIRRFAALMRVLLGSTVVLDLDYDTPN